MKKFFIKKYIDKLTVYDIDEFAKKNDIFLNNNEINYIYNLIKNDWQNFLNNDELIIYQIKNTFNFNTSQKILNLYYLYKEKYKNYLN